MGIRRFLAAEGNAGVIDDIFLSQHGEKKRVILVVVQGMDTFRKCGQRGMLQRLHHDGGPNVGIQAGTSFPLLHLLDDFPKQLFHVDLERDDVSRHAFIELIRPLGQEE